MNYYVPQPYGVPMVVPYGQVVAPQVVHMARPAVHLARPITAGPVLVQNPPQPKSKPITLYVGHLTSKVKDDFFKTMLGYCGPLRSWKRVTSSFGFVEFHSSDGASRAMRVLAGKTLFGKKLLINADKKTKEVLDRYDEQIKSGKARPPVHPHAHADSINKSSVELQSQHDQVAVSLIDTLITNVEKNYEARKLQKEEDKKASREASKSKSRSPSKSPSPAEEKKEPEAPEAPATSERDRSSDKKRKRSRSSERRKRSKDRSRSRSRSRSRRRRKKRRRRDRDSSEEGSKKKASRRDPEKPPEPGQAEAPKTAKELVHFIPRDQAKLLKYTIDWKMIDDNDLVEKTMRGWIDARIKEYLGEEEADLTNFAVGLLAHHIPPKDIIAEMEMVLVEDAEGFVVKMWRRLIFESLKIKYSIK